MSKYIIKNCPAYFFDNVDNKCTSDDNVEWGTNCQDCTDCVMKQIVELCNENLNHLETYVDVRSLECVTLQNILQLLDIQEVE